MSNVSKALEASRLSRRGFVVKGLVLAAGLLAACDSNEPGPSPSSSTRATGGIPTPPSQSVVPYSFTAEQLLAMSNFSHPMYKSYYEGEPKPEVRNGSVTLRSSSLGSHGSITRRGQDTPDVPIPIADQGTLIMEGDFTIEPGSGKVAVLLESSGNSDQPGPNINASYLIFIQNGQLYFGSYCNRQPYALLVDEPFAALSGNSQHRIENRLLPSTSANPYGVNETFRYAFILNTEGVCIIVEGPNGKQTFTLDPQRDANARNYIGTRTLQGFRAEVRDGASATYRRPLFTFHPGRTVADMIPAQGVSLFSGPVGASRPPVAPSANPNPSPGLVLSTPGS